MALLECQRVRWKQCATPFPMTGPPPGCSNNRRRLKRRLLPTGRGDQDAALAMETGMEIVARVMAVAQREMPILRLPSILAVQRTQPTSRLRAGTKRGGPNARVAL